MAFVFAGCALSQDSTASTSLPETSAETFTPMKTRLVDKANSTLEPGYLENTIESEATPEAILENKINPSDSPVSSPANITPLKPTVAMPTPTRAPFITSDLDRFGVTIARINHDAEAAFALGLPFGSALNWNVMRQPPEVPAEFWQLVRVNEEGIRSTDWGTIEEVLTAYPGSYWIVGNEPDVKWQDNVTPQRYAEIYHEVYTFIKEKDPSAIVVIGGVAQPTPLRRAYLDIVLDTYESNYGVPMPIDVWNVHAFILREEEDSWGVGIPPGLEEEEGILYEIEDHDNVQILEQNIRDFREWMAGRGYGERPLVISEYGILMPEDYGFPPERVSAFLESSFDLFNELVGGSGYSSDGNRLVQWWFWYSIYDDLLYPTGNLWDEKTGQLTKLGQSWTRYLTMKGINKTDQGDTADH
jgi:hypothetical protein